MSLAGLRKQINKANQFVSEKIGGAKGTELDEEFVEKEKKIDLTSKLIEELIARTHEFLQPNPATRARLATMNRFHQFQGKNKATMYPQPEGQLGDCMVKYGNDLGAQSAFGQALQQTGEAFRQLAEIKYNLEDLVKQNFLEPLHGLQTRELKEINHHRKKLEGRRLDFDCKKRKEKEKETNKAIEDEIRFAEEKYYETKALADTAMVNFLNSETEHIQALTEFVNAELEYHRQAADILENLVTALRQKRDDASQTVRYQSNPANLRPPSRAMSESASGRTSPYPGAGESRSSATPVLDARHDGDGSSQMAASHDALNPFAPYNRSTSNLSSEAGNSNWSNDGSNSTAPVASSVTTPAKRQTTPSCRALFAFEAENETELPFNEGDLITLIQQVDENWFEGELNGKRGYFPVDYVEVVVPL